MDVEALRDYCLSKRLATECFPFDETTLVFKVGSKMFALVDLGNPEWVVLKSDPDEAIDLRDRYADILPAYHMNKKHWIQVRLEGGVPARVLKELVDCSYRLVIAKMTRKERMSLFPDGKYF